MILDYCRELFDTLENLEGLLKGSEDLREDYRKKISPQIARQASILDILVSIGMIVYFMPDKTVFFSNLVPGTGPVDLFFRMSAITFLSLLLGYGSRLGLTWLWQHNYLPGGRKHIARFYKKKYLKKQNVINLYYKREKSQVTINFLDSDNTGLKVQKSETMTVNVGEYVWPINYGAMTSQSTKSVYHMYQIPTILNYSYQNSDSDTPLLVANDSATNVINLYYKRDKSQVTVEFLDTKGKSIRANDTITANVGDYIWIVSLGVNSEQMKFGVYWYFVPKIGGYSFNHGTPIKVSKDAGSNIVKLYYDTEYSFDYEYDKGTPNQSSPLPDSFVAKKDDVIMSNLPEGYFISEVIDNNGKSYTDPEVAISQQEDTSPKSFKIIVSAKESNLKLTVNKPVGGESTKEFSGLYGETYQIPIDEILTTNGKTYRAIVKIQKVDWKNGITTTIIEDPEEIASLLKGNLLVGKYDSQTTSISVSYKEKAAIPPLPSKDEGDEGDDSSPSTPVKSIESSKQNEPDKQKVPAPITSITSQPEQSHDKEKVKEKNVEEPKKTAPIQKSERPSQSPENQIKAPLAPPTPSFSTTQKAIANRSIASEVNQKAHILKLRIAGAAGLAAGTASAYGILRALKMMLQHFGKLSNLIK
ncbi:hypothetical protein N41_0036 [Lactococcus cremoris]|uniref:hypothetical protein n=1 Tax=Lactococcus lactis subsp. cremoris TaxID=1359 RepID=UPI0007AE8DA4|nr:hypothetical protein [Lactococcus cremoris]KZK41899.1 hypothetical protein N41_0036 [Lactococcus cremoris]